MQEIVALRNQHEAEKKELRVLVTKLETKLKVSSNNVEVQAIAAKKKDDKLATLEGKLHTQENELREVKAAFEEANNNHEHIIDDVITEREKETAVWEAELKKKDEDCHRMRHGWEELVNRCKYQNAELVKQTEVKVIECDKQLQEITSLQDQVVVLTGKCEASKNCELALELELRREKDEQTVKVRLLLEEKNLLGLVFEDALAKFEKIHYELELTKRELYKLKEDNQLYQIKVEEKDKRIDQLSRTAKSKRRYIKSDKEDEMLCDKVCELVQHFTGTCPDCIQLQKKIKDLEIGIEQLTVQSVNHKVAQRDHENEISDLKEQIQIFISKVEASKRSREEATATSSKLNEEVMVLTQQVNQYKKQADNLRSQVEKYEQMNKSHVEQVHVHIYYSVSLTIACTCWQKLIYCLTLI